MSALAYPEPYKFSAGALALLVHGAFFILLYLGFNWQMQPPQGMVVDIWDSLPQNEEPAAAVLPQQQEQPRPQAKPQQEEQLAPPRVAEKSVPAKADIEVTVKKKVKQEKIKQKVEKDDVVAKLTPKQLAEQKAAYAKRLQQESEQQAKESAQQAAAQEQAAAMGRIVDEYRAKISSKIRRNIVAPPGVTSKIRAEFDVTLLPGGLVMETRLTRSSGNGAYDDAVERGILKAQPLPLPPDGVLFNRFRDLHLKFSPD
jgi:colicin import membrane protein